MKIGKLSAEVHQSPMMFNHFKSSKAIYKTKPNKTKPRKVSKSKKIINRNGKTMKRLSSVRLWVISNVIPHETECMRLGWNCKSIELNFFGSFYLHTVRKRFTANELIEYWIIARLAPYDKTKDNIPFTAIEFSSLCII